jgi:hypothetical protein
MLDELLAGSTKKDFLPSVEDRFWVDFEPVGKEI